MLEKGVWTEGVAGAEKLGCKSVGRLHQGRERRGEHQGAGKDRQQQTGVRKADRETRHINSNNQKCSLL